MLNFWADGQPGLWPRASKTTKHRLSRRAHDLSVSRIRLCRPTAVSADLLSEIYQAMIDSIKPSFPDCIQALRANIRLDPHFQDFYFWAKAHGIPVIVLSSGLTPTIRALLETAIGADAATIEIVCNEVVDRQPKTRDQPGGWNVQFHDPSDFGHDKSLTIRPYVEHFQRRPDEPRPTLMYAGDGVSDLSAARETDLLFAKKGRGPL